MSAPIVITVPTKFIPINLAPAIIKNEPLSLNGSDGEESTSSMDEFLIRGKKRRLDHLTWEEKLQRKKLKNRVAAQTSRDRKKAKMEDMERTIQEQTDQINDLKSKCDQLQSEKNDIYNKYLSLETRFEELQRRIDEQQQVAFHAATPIKSELIDSTTSSSVGSVSTPLIGSAAGILYGSTDDTAPSNTEIENDRRQDSGPMEDNCSLPALQDMLEDFDVSKLEELAESLLANVTSELEDTNRASCTANAESTSPSLGMFGSVVGTSSEQLESSEDSTADQGSSLILTTHNYSKSPFHIPSPLESHQQSSSESISKQQTVFGTYDNETNCITIVLKDDEFSLEEEIICEESEEEQTLPEQEFNIKLEPVQELLSPIPSTCSNYSISMATASAETTKDNEQSLKCPLTPKSFVSDAGYESLGSPISANDFGMSSLDEIWNLDLFPILS